MKKILSSITAILGVLVACATLSGKMGQSRLDGIVARCQDEHLSTRPSKVLWHNLSTLERNKKKREFDEWQKKRIDLYRALETFRDLYRLRVDDDGKCRKNECQALQKIRMKIIDACPEAGDSLPDADAAS